MYRVYRKYINKLTGEVKEIKLTKHYEPQITTQQKLKNQGFECVQIIYIDAFAYNFLKTLDK